MALIASLSLELVVLLALYVPRASLITSTASKVRCKALSDLTVFIPSFTNLINLKSYVEIVLV